MDIKSTSQTLEAKQHNKIDELEALLELEALGEIPDQLNLLSRDSSNLGVDGLPRENLLDSAIKLAQKSNINVPESFFDFLDKVARKEETTIFPRINSAVLLGYMATPFLEKFPGLAKILDQIPRVDLISRACEKIIKSAKRNDLLRVTAGGADILNSLFRPVKDIYLGRSIVVLLTNLAETLEEVFQMKNASYENLAEGVHKAVDLVDKACNDIVKNPDKIKSPQWHRDSGVLGIASSATGALSFLGEITKNTPLALVGRFLQTYTSDGDKFLSNNPDRNYSGFGFTLENALDNIVRFTDGKVPRHVTKILLATQYMISSASRTLAIRSQAAEHKPSMDKIYEKPWTYLRKASASLFRALNPFDIAASHNLEPAMT
ncbi:MAG: hypothetical protein MK033_12410 [Candidatus Caenarcaniphilales bacterium]|nr:hypothetical protein [Candidatus Caenarcaniphilales bacterium]